MKKSKFVLISSVLILAMILGQITSVRGTTYTCTGKVGAEAVWKVKTVHPGALAEIFGASPAWETALYWSFGAGSQIENARMKSKVTYVNSSYVYDFGIGNFDICLINTSVWVWTTHPFAATPNVTNIPTTILMHPENLTTWCQTVAWPYNVSFAVAWWFFEGIFVNFLAGLPIPVATYLSELVWDNDYTIVGTTVTHNVVAGYIGFYGITYLVNCTETWRYSSQYGTFLGYKLVHYNGTTAYETVLEVAPGVIPGFELPIVIGVSMGLIIGLIFVIMKKKK